MNLNNVSPPLSPAIGAVAMTVVFVLGAGTVAAEEDDGPTNEDGESLSL